MELDQIIKLVQTVSESSLNGFTLEEGNFKLSLSKEEPKVLTMTTSEALDTSLLSSTSVVLPQASEPVTEGKAITSVLVGVFYDSPSPEAESFVKVGDTVKKGQVLGIIEAMKLMNEIESDVEGTITEILVKNGDMVEYGQPLFRVK